MLRNDFLVTLIAMLSVVSHIAYGQEKEPATSPLPGATAGRYAWRRFSCDRRRTSEKTSARSAVVSSGPKRMVCESPLSRSVH